MVYNEFCRTVKLLSHLNAYGFFCYDGVICTEVCPIIVHNNYYFSLGQHWSPSYPLVVELEGFALCGCGWEISNSENI